MFEIEKILKAKTAVNERVWPPNTRVKREETSLRSRVFILKGKRKKVKGGPAPVKTSEVS